MDSASEKSGKNAPVGTTVNERNVDIAAELASGDAPIDPQVALNIKCDF